MKKMLALAALLATGCIPAYRQVFYSRSATFNPAEHASFAGQGDATITGQAFLKTVGGDVKYGAGNTIILVPATSYTKEWFDHAVLLQEQIGPPVAEAATLTRSTQADGEGRFTFSTVPPGRYYVACEIVWGVPTYFMGVASVNQTGGVAYAVVEAKGGASVSAIVTRNASDPPPRLVREQQAAAKQKPARPTDSGYNPAP